jgi:hypothetical protein
LWLQYLGNGADGANTTASGALYGEKYYTNFTVPYGNTVTVNALNGGLVVHATGTCTIAGTITANGSQNTVSTTGFGGAPGGGGGGGTVAGAVGKVSTLNNSGSASIGLGEALYGAAGAASGGAGGSPSALTTGFERAIANSGGGTDGAYLQGAAGGAGGSSGGAAGNGGAGVVLICATITGTDGTHTGTIDVSGAAGVAAAANNTGGGGGGGGGVILLSSQAAVTNWPTLNVAGGAGGGCGTFTGCGAGGTGGAGWYAEFQGW